MINASFKSIDLSIATAGKTKENLEKIIPVKITITIGVTIEKNLEELSPKILEINSIEKVVTI